MKLTKAQLKIQREVEAVLNNDQPLTFEQKEYIYEAFNEGAIADVTTDSAYFTPLDLAYDFALFAPRHGVMVDMCAGFGVLAFCALVRDTYEGNIKQQICIERNPRFIEIGKKLLPNAEWIQADMFDKAAWDDIIKRYGKIDSLVSNPPFGKVSKTSMDKSWLKYQGADIDMSAIEIALRYATDVAMLLPKSSCTFRYSGRPYYEDVENRKVDKLKKESGIQFTMTNPGIDTSVYSKFKNTPIGVEHVDFVDVVLPNNIV